MLNKNIKNLNKMLVKSNENMFGGSTKRPPPSSTPAAVAMATTPTSSRRVVRLSETEFSPPSAVLKISPLTRTALPLGGVAAVANLPNKSVTVSASSASSSSLLALSLSSSSSSSSTSCSPMPLPFSPTSQSTSLRTALRTRTATRKPPSETPTTSNIFAGRTKLLEQRHRHQQQQQQRQQYHNHHHHQHHNHHHHHHTPQWHFRLLPGLKATSFFTIMTLVCLETVLLSTVSNCAQTFYMHWNTSNSIFRIDNTDHIIDVNKGNPAFEFDQVHIICPVYEPGTFENETEKYIIYNVSKVEYETCRITNADPRVIAICDKPQKLMFFTITFRPFTPQPGGLEFLPGNDYYFISTSSKDDLYRRIGGRCSTNNMKVVFKVCCAPEDKNNRTNNNIGVGSGGGVGGGGGIGNGGGSGNIGSGTSSSSNSNTAIQQQHNNNININGGIGGGGGIGQLPSPKLPGMGGMNNGGGLMINGNSGTSINTNIDQFNRIPMQQPNNIGGMGGMGMGMGMGMGGIGGGGGGGGGSISGHQTGIRINNVPSSQQHPSQKNDDYDKHPNEVVKNEELTYNSAASSLSFYKIARRRTVLTLRKNTRHNSGSLSAYESIYQKFKSLLQLLLFTSNHRNRINTINTFINFISNCNPIIITITVLVTLTNLFQYKLSTWSLRGRCISSSTSSSSSLKVSSNVVAKAESQVQVPVQVQVQSSVQADVRAQMQTAIDIAIPVAVSTRTSCNELRHSPQTLPPTPIQPPPPLLLSPLNCIETAVAAPTSNTLNITSSIR